MSEERRPLGLKPKWLHDEQRTHEIIEAMERYARANVLIPIEWVDELKSLCERHDYCKWCPYYPTEDSD